MFASFKETRAFLATRDLAPTWILFLCSVWFQMTFSVVTSFVSGLFLNFYPTHTLGHHLMCEEILKFLLVAEIAVACVHATCL